MMNTLSLKQQVRNGVARLVVMASILGNIPVIAQEPVLEQPKKNIEKKPHPQVQKEIHLLLTTCIFDRSNNKPFSYFIDELISLIEEQMEAVEKLVDAKNKAQYINTFIKALKKIRTSKDILAINSTLKSYQVFAPPSFKNNLKALAEGLQFRLSCLDVPVNCSGVTQTVIGISVEIFGKK